MPIHEAIIAALRPLGPVISGLYKRLGGQSAPIRVAFELMVPTFRTAGYFQNRLFRGLLGREATPQERLLGGVTSGWPVPVNPFFVAFLSGMAYQNDEELAEGWLSTFGKLLLSPVVETDLEHIIVGAATGDFFQFFDALSEWTSEAIGLETAAAFFRGAKKAAEDFKALTGVSIPVNYLGELLIWADNFVQGAFDEPFPWPPRDPGEWPFARPELPEAPALLNFPATPGWRESWVSVWPEIAPAVRRVASDLIKSAGSRLASALKLEESVPEDVKDKLKSLLMGGAAFAKTFAGEWPGPGGEGKRTRV